MDPAELLHQLIALPSVNPAFLPAGHPYAGEQKVCEFLATVTSRHGLTVERQPVFPGRSNLIARLVPSGKVRRRILLVPHMDTVGATEGQLVPITRNGRIYGRGACDTKGSIAAMVSALVALAGSATRPAETEILLAAMVDEENGQSGARALGASGIKADFAIVGEPTRLSVVTAHKGDVWLELRTRGLAAHGATPHLGRNAIHEMARAVRVLETEYAARLRRRRHALLGHGTINVGSIAGGRQPNIVPDRCEISLDRRTLPGETAAGVRREIRALLRRRGLKVAVTDVKGAPCLPMETDPQLPWVRELMELTGQRGAKGVHFFCDASVLAHAGIPSVVFGPGDIAQAHTESEWISVASLERATRLLGRFLAGFP